MWPWGHLAVGYLLYSAIVRLQARTPLRRDVVLLLAVGTQFPDLVDKPLWMVGFLPSGRTLAHSLVTAAIVVSVAYLFLRRRGRGQAAFAFGVGYVAHILTDGFKPLLVGEWQYVVYLFWPLLGVHGPPYHGFRIVVFEPLEFFLGREPVDVDISLYLLLQLFLFVAAAYVWVADGTPGLSE